MVFVFLNFFDFWLIWYFDFVLEYRVFMLIDGGVIEFIVLFSVLF